MAIAAENKKQGSSEETVEYSIFPAHKFAKECYENMLKLGIAPEMARMVLPQSMMTEWYWSGTLMAFARVCNLRCKPDAQKETQNVGWGIDKYARKLFPACWRALRERASCLGNGESRQGLDLKDKDSMSMYGL